MEQLIKPTTVRINGDIKDQAVQILDSMGLSFNSYVNIAIHQLVNQGRIPFEIIPSPDLPNETTHRAMIAAQAKSLGLIPDDAKSFDSADELMDYLEG